MPLFRQTIGIKQAGALVNLDLEVYSGADILVKYGGGVPQWFRAKPSSDASLLSRISVVASAHAQAPTPSEHEKGTKTPARAIIGPSIVLDLDKAVAVRSRALEITPPSQDASSRVERAYLLARTKDDHRGWSPSTSTYTAIFRADPGYKIVDHEIQISTSSRAEITSVARAADGLSLTVTYSLTSGPVFDQWRGWIKATVKTAQTPLR